MQSFFIGLGAAVANALPDILGRFGVAGNAAQRRALHVLYAFKLGAAAFLVAVLYTVLPPRSIPPENMAEFLRRRRAAHPGLASSPDVSAVRMIGRAASASPGAPWWITILPLWHAARAAPPSAGRLAPC